jgi:hypothetical protein
MNELNLFINVSEGLWLLARIYRLLLSRGLHEGPHFFGITP